MRLNSIAAVYVDIRSCRRPRGASRRSVTPCEPTKGRRRARAGNKATTFVHRVPERVGDSRTDISLRRKPDVPSHGSSVSATGREALPGGGQRHWLGGQLQLYAVIIMPTRRSKAGVLVGSGDLSVEALVDPTALAQEFYLPPSAGHRAEHGVAWQSADQSLRF